MARLLDVRIKRNNGWVTHNLIYYEDFISESDTYLESCFPSNRRI